MKFFEGENYGNLDALGEETRERALAGGRTQEKAEELTDVAVIDFMGRGEDMVDDPALWVRKLSEFIPRHVASKTFEECFEKASKEV